MTRTRVLFVCGKNRWRSPTAEHLYAGREDLAVLSAGTASDADVPLDAETLVWADRIFVMEARHRRAIQKRFAKAIDGKTIVNLGIPDRFCFMQAELIDLLRRKLGAHLGEP